MYWNQRIGYANIGTGVLDLTKSALLHVPICALVSGRREVKSGQVQEIFT